MEEAWFWGVWVGFGGREGALASALICVENVNTVENLKKNFENMAFSMIFYNFPIFERNFSFSKTFFSAMLINEVITFTYYITL